MKHLQEEKIYTMPNGDDAPKEVIGGNGAGGEDEEEAPR